MKKPGMIFDFNNENLIWDDVIVPMWRAGYNCLKPTLRRSEIKQVMQMTTDTKVTRESTEVIVKIMDSKHDKANLEDIAQSAHQLYMKEKIMHLHLLKYFEELFGVTLVKLNTDPVEIGINPDAKLLSSRY